MQFKHTIRFSNPKNKSTNMEHRHAQKKKPRSKKGPYKHKTKRIRRSFDKNRILIENLDQKLQIEKTQIRNHTKSLRKAINNKLRSHQRS